MRGSPIYHYALTLALAILAAPFAGFMFNAPGSCHLAVEIFAALLAWLLAMMLWLARGNPLQDA